MHPLPRENAVKLTVLARKPRLVRLACINRPLRLRARRRPVPVHVQGPFPSPELTRQLVVQAILREPGEGRGVELTAQPLGIRGGVAASLRPRIVPFVCVWLGGARVDDGEGENRDKEDEDS